MRISDWSSDVCSSDLSGGRGESLLAMDQDNAIVFAAGAPDGPQDRWPEDHWPEDRWFERLGGLVSDMLTGAGVAYCPGGAMASQPDRRLDLPGWHRPLDPWIAKERPPHPPTTTTIF